jgi:flagellar biosynthesis GTPase FlhF
MIGRQQQRTSGMAIAGFVCAFVCSPIGLILSILGNSEVKKSNGMVGGGGLAIAGIVISAVNIVGGILAMVFFVFVARAASHDIEEINKRIETEERQVQQQIKAAEAAQRQVETVQREVEDLAEQTRAAEEAVAAASNKAERDAASAKLAALQHQLEEATARKRQAEEAAARANRLEGVHIDQRCIDNPLAKGC